MRLDLLLSRRIEGVSRSRIQQLIANGSVFRNGKSVRKRQCVVEGDRIEITARVLPSRGESPLPQNIPVDILYEDDHLLAVNKPAGLVVHPGSGVPDGTLVNALLYHTPGLSTGSSQERPGIVHRLDKETSGVLLVAKNNRVHMRLSSAFSEKKVSKQYLGICMGRPSPDVGVIDLPLDRSRREPIKRAVTARGKPAETRFETIMVRSGISIIRFSPQTGRTHQIRVHCSAAGFPILADALYGGGRERILRIDPVERPFAYKIHKCFERHALHAMRITFAHPETHQLITITAPLPDDFRNALMQFGNPELFEKCER